MRRKYITNMKRDAGGFEGDRCCTQVLTHTQNSKRVADQEGAWNDPFDVGVVLDFRTQPVPDLSYIAACSRHPFGQIGNATHKPRFSFTPHNLSAALQNRTHASQSAPLVGKPNRKCTPSQR